MNKIVNGREKGSKLLNAQCFSYHTGYKGSQAAQWELCSSPELVWWRGQSPEVQFLEWWAEEEPVEHTGLLGVCQITVVRFMKMVLNWFVERGQEMEVKHWKTRGGLRGGRWTGDGGGGVEGREVKGLSDG